MGNLRHPKYRICHGGTNSFTFLRTLLAYPPRPRHCEKSVDCYYIDAEDIDGREGAWSVHRESWADHRELPGPLIDHHHADRYRIIGVLFRHDLPGIDDKSSGIKGA